jgi:hypothetical protein
VDGVDAAGVAVGLAVPIATFTGLWFWRLRPGRRRAYQPDASQAATELAESVIGVHARLDDLQEQVTELSQDWEERDKQLAERISGLIDMAARAADFAPRRPGPPGTGPGGDGDGKHGGT